MVIFACLGCIGNKAENNSAGSVENGSASISANVSGNASTGGGTVLKDFPCRKFERYLSRNLKPSLKPSTRVLMFSGKLQAAPRA